MSSKTRAVARVLARGVSEPRLALTAIRERGVGYVFDQLVRSSPEKLDDMVYGLAVRSASEKIESVRRLFGEILSEIADEDEGLYRVRLASGPAFLIRKRACMTDMRRIWETFVREDYRGHPDLTGRTVLDVGANLGDTPVYYALRGARVIAYEPSSELCDLAVRNAAINNLDIEVNNLGIGCEDGTLEMAISLRGATPLSMTVFPGTVVPKDPRLMRRTQIRVVPLADVLARIGPVFLLKMDCEGCEYPALLSLSADQLRSIEHVVVEFHGSADPLRQRLEENGFRVRAGEWKLLLADRCLQ